jgi:hypothetical protein
VNASPALWRPCGADRAPLIALVLVPLVVALPALVGLRRADPALEVGHVGAPIFITFAETGAAPRFPTAIAATGVMILAFLSLACAFILDSIPHGRLETRRLFYLLTPAAGAERP